MRYPKVVVLLVIMLLASCQQSGQYAFDDIEYLTSFGANQAFLPARSGSTINLEIAGIQGFKIFSRYLIVSSHNDAGQISVFEKDSPYRLLGSFFPKGNGPGELIYPVNPRTFQFFTDEDGTIYAVFNNGKSQLIRFDITHSIEEGRTVTVELEKTAALAFDVVDLKEDGCFYKEMTPEKDAFKRYIIKDGERFSTKSMEKLNAARIRNKVDDGTRFNVLYGSVLYDGGKKIFAEVPGEINAVHLYSLDDSFAKTICFGEKLYDYNEVADREYENRPITATCVQQYEDFFVILYIDESMKDYYTDDTRRPSLIIVPWDGNDIRKLNIPDRVTSFDLDMDTFYLWAFDSDTETMYVYDVSKI